MRESEREGENRKICVNREKGKENGREDRRIRWEKEKGREV